MKKISGALFILLLIAITYRLLFLLPWSFVAGSFDMADIALLLIIAGVFANFNKIVAANILREPLAILIILYFFMLSMHVSLASFNYHQGLLNGVIAIRYQFFYLLFFVSIALLDSEKKITLVLDMISYLAMIALLVGIINYLGVKVLFHYKADGWGGIRAGYQRIFIPGMPLVAFSVLWQLAKWINAVPRFTGSKLLFLWGGIIFYRGRGLILGLAIISIFMMFFKKKYKSMLGLFVAGVIVITLAEFTMKENIFLYPIKGVSEGIETDKGEGGRFDQLEHDIEKFKEYPWIGSGLIAIRVSDIRSSSKRRELSTDVRLVDLGYSHWIKHYGLLGIVWLLVFYWCLLKLSISRLKEAKYNLNPIDLFAPAYIGFVMITSVLHNHLMVESRIVLLALVAAILVLRRNKKNENTDITESVDAQVDKTTVLQKKEVRKSLSMMKR